MRRCYRIAVLSGCLFLGVILDFERRCVNRQLLHFSSEDSHSKKGHKPDLFAGQYQSIKPGFWLVLTCCDNNNHGSDEINGVNMITAVSPKFRYGCMLLERSVRYSSGA